MPYEPLLVQSIGNQFIFRCVDGVHIDGKDRGLSRMLYKLVKVLLSLCMHMTCEVCMYVCMSWSTFYLR